MKLVNIKLTNFRQFYGVQSVAFATDPIQNVTLFHAENGVGKTTLLNAILWCFYGKGGVTEKFHHSEDIVSYQAVSEGSYTARVDVTFEHEGSLFNVGRRYKSAPGTKVEERVTAFQIVNGNNEPLTLPEAFILTVIPSEMAPHYFFDGEHAETFASPENFRQVGAAIRNMLGSTVAEAAIDDLKYAGKSFGEELSELPGEELIKQKSAELAEAQRRLDVFLAQKKETEESLVVYKEQIAIIDEQLLDSRDAKELQQQRKDLENTLASASSSVLEAERDVIGWIGRKAISVIAHRLSEETLHFIDEEKLRGKIPSPYNEELVNQLLADQVCICGRTLEPQSESFITVMNQLRKAGNADVQNRVMLARGRITALKEARLDAPKDLERFQRTRAGAFDRVRAAEQKLAWVSEKLSKIDIDHIAANEKARVALNAKITAANQTIGAARLSISGYEAKVESIKLQQQRLATNNAKATRLLVRRGLAETAAEMLKMILSGHEHTAKQFITKEVNEILEATARRHYKFSFTEGFAFDLTFENGRTVPRSSGENQLLSLAFIAA